MDLYKTRLFLGLKKEAVKYHLSCRERVALLVTSIRSRKIRIFLWECYGRIVSNEIVRCLLKTLH